MGQLCTLFPSARPAARLAACSWQVRRFYRYRAARLFANLIRESRRNLIRESRRNLIRESCRNLIRESCRRRISRR
ncbi:hypothetical protein AB0J63_26935 [Streptosporangium canum]|uniref:hypothetical protein n=1 Tax=Streptosporangium canum TaxID=324952 RepID=UPI00342C826F